MRDNTFIFDFNLGKEDTPVPNNSLIDKMSPDEAHFLDKCCKYLRVLGLVRTKSQFCEEFLKKSADYMSMIQSSHRTPSISCLHHLLLSMQAKADEYELNHQKQGQYQNLLHLIKEGQNFITNRLLKDYY